jgi:transposase
MPVLLAVPADTSSNIHVLPLAAPTVLPTMFVGLDVHKQATQVCILDAHGTVVDERRISTTRHSLSELFRDSPRQRIVLEASTESEWVARTIEQCGHEDGHDGHDGHDVIVADPNFAPMYATRSKAIKTDKRDARALADACRLGAYRAVHRTSDAMRQVRDQLLVREALIRTRTRYVSLIRARLRREGVRLGTGAAATFGARLRRLFDVGTPGGAHFSAEASNILAPLLRLLTVVDAEILAADDALLSSANADPVCQRLMTMPGIGPVTATAFRASVDDVTRFDTPQQLSAYIGLVPSERSSGERQHRGRLTKRGDSRLRSLLIEAGWRLLFQVRPVRGKTPATELALKQLKAWGGNVAMRRGRHIAATALGRKVSVILYAMWRDGTDFGVPHGTTNT